MGIWIDSDMGVDDLFAILLVMRHREVDGLSLNFGNSTLDQVSRNAAGARLHFGWDVPISAGADRAILGSVETAQRILGQTGMPSRGLRLPQASADFAPAQPALSVWLGRQTDAEILALGPLTNLAILVLNRPELIERIGRVVWMGGGITRGNHTVSAEFNAFADPEALAIMLARDVPIAMVDLDACRQIEIVGSDVERLQNSTLLKDLLGGYLDIGLSRGRSSMALYDPVAAALCVRPELFELVPAWIEVELAGPVTRGRTVVDLRAPAQVNASVVQNLQASGIKELCLAAWEELE